MSLCYPDTWLDMGRLKWIVRADKDLDPQGKWSMGMPWAEREAFVSRIHKIDTGILTGCAGMHNFDQLFGLC